ncbi:hypothetical protein D6V20_08770 [Vibrio cholerae]|nr:hypothetical protein [Vibrio cholerae]
MTKFVRSNHRVCLCSWGMMRPSLALSKGQPMDVQVCSRQICHSLVTYLQRQVVWVYPYLPYGFWDYFVGQLSMVRRFALS